MTTADPPPSEAPDETVPLVFQWERRRHAHWRLAALVALSLVIHAAGFYLFQAAYTPTGSQASPSVQVTMLPLERPGDPPEVRAQAHALANWLAVGDPSLAIEPATLADPGTGGFVEYVPSYRAAPPPFKPLDPQATGSVPPPRPRPLGPVPMPAVNLAAAPAAAATAPTRVMLSSALAPLAQRVLPPITFAMRAGVKPLGTTVFLVGVRPEGGAPFLFREESSGEVAADDFAQDYLARLSFQAPAGAEGTTIWGRAEFHWGRDVYHSPSAP